MIGTTLTITVNAVAKVLNRVSSADPYAAVYFLAETGVDWQLTIKHTVPALRGASKESHLVRFDVTRYTGAEVTTKESTWIVMEASVGVQDLTNIRYEALGLFAAMDTTMLGKILGRDS
jgi:hypothetical protein